MVQYQIQHSLEEARKSLFAMFEKFLRNNPFIDQKFLDEIFDHRSKSNQFTLHFQCGWGTEVTLYIDFDRLRVEDHRKIYKLETMMGSSSTQRSIASSKAMLTVYEEALKIASLIENEFRFEYWEFKE